MVIYIVLQTEHYTNCALLLADLFLHACETDFLEGPFKTRR